MKKISLILFLFQIVFLSCDNINDENNCQPETTLSKWESEKEIMLEFNEAAQRNHYQVANGNKLVFNYIHVGAQCDDIIDDEWAEVLIFQIENDIEEFEFVDDEILTTNCFYFQNGAWAFGTQQNVKKGFIRGEKISVNTWEINVNIETNTINQDEPIRNIEFEGKFTN
ncbi:hypothetical protein RXV94_10025 [Yeosuana sp. MJ-SS3]|jgi:hypothetical protein|uniref:Gliding motility lipoprotein GldH n=1 Tax=Gilvirhabdus luticola TaxID=3079858 RepID=A0ABU3U7W1_9FLAO|nr:hypothetical protein [Yeosuana sp. MJ-SS3]MDU8886498.1 hypothetical protein [Yeosuana sp. MJ-SS3]